MSKEVCVLLSEYGECGYFEALIDSLQGQTESPEILLRCDDENTGEHLGIKGSIRDLLSRVPASCSYVMFCDQDDVWFPRKIGVLLDGMKKAEKNRTGPVLVHADAVVADRDLRILKRRFISKWARHADFFGTLMFNKVQGASMMINRPLLELVKDLPDEGPLYDRYIHLMAEIFGVRIFIDRPLMYYRQHGANEIGAFGRKPRLTARFLNEDDLVLSKGNDYVLRRYASALDKDKKKIAEEYREFISTRSPFRRLVLILRYLTPYPGTMVKKLIKLFFR